LEIVALLRRLSEASGVSGYEDQVRAIVREQFGRHADEVREDALGNVIALKRARARSRPSVMLATLDEWLLSQSRTASSTRRVGGYGNRVLWARGGGPWWGLAGVIDPARPRPAQASQTDRSARQAVTHGTNARAVAG
jgi:endoglucanase